MWLQSVSYEGDWYPSNENAYQAAKFKKSFRTPFFTCTPQEAKRLGQEKVGRLYSDEEWVVVKISIMAELSLTKFSSADTLKSKLILTDQALLVEGNWWKDTFWGVYVDEEGNESGENNLGKIHMYTRKVLVEST